MAKWLCVREQRGEGCDYSIGCGKDFDIIEADDLKEAKRLAIKASFMEEALSGECDPSYYISGEGALKSWNLYKISGEHDLMPLLAAAGVEYKKVVEDDAKARRRAEFEKLRQEFGD